MTGEQIDVASADGPMPAWRFIPQAGSGPGIVLFQEIFGVTDYIKRRAEDLAGLGYVVLVPEIYWRLDDAEIDEGRPDLLEAAMAVVGRLDWGSAVSDGVAALAALRQDAQVRGGVGAMGFCFGGGLAFNVAAEDDPEVLVSYYGSALPDLLDRAGDVTAPSLHHFGDADAYIPIETVERIRSAVDRDGVRFELYAGAGHAFDNPLPMFHHADASAKAWQTTTKFLEEQLPTRPE